MAVGVGLYGGFADPEAEGSCLSDATADILTERGPLEVLYRSEVLSQKTTAPI